jgi:ATP-dependent DNA helicase RecG
VIANRSIWVKFNISGELNGELNGELTDRQALVYKEIRNNPGINARELSETLEIPFSTVDKYIRIFNSKGIIERKGSKKTGGYYIYGKQIQ